MPKSPSFYKKLINKITQEPKIYIDTYTGRPLRQSEDSLNKKFQKELKEVENEIRYNLHIGTGERRKLLDDLKKGNIFDEDHIRTVDDNFENMFSPIKKKTRRRSGRKRKTTKRSKRRTSKRRN